MTDPRLPHPDDCREDLRAIARRRATHERQGKALQHDLKSAAATSVQAGLSITEIAALAGVTRATVHTAIRTPRSSP